MSRKRKPNKHLARDDIRFNADDHQRIKAERDYLRAEKAFNDAMLRGGLPEVIEIIRQLQTERDEYAQDNHVLAETLSRESPLQIMRAGSVPSDVFSAAYETSIVGFGPKRIDIADMNVIGITAFREPDGKLDVMVKMSQVSLTREEYHAYEDNNMRRINVSPLPSDISARGVFEWGIDDETFRLEIVQKAVIYYLHGINSDAYTAKRDELINWVWRTHVPKELRVSRREYNRAMKQKCDKSCENIQNRIDKAKKSGNLEISPQG